MTVSRAPGIARTAWLLLRTARRRAEKRRQRQRELLGRQNRPGSRGRGGFGLLVTVLVGLALNGAGALFIWEAVIAGERAAVEQHGLMPVDGWFIATVERHSWLWGADPAEVEVTLRGEEAQEAAAIGRTTGGDRVSIERRLRAIVRSGRIDRFADEDLVAPGFAALRLSGLPALFGSLALFCWCLVPVLGGEGLELDVGRRRHPIWEWLLGHPVRPVAVFLAEMLAPIAANPVLWTTPLGPAILYGSIYGAPWGLLALILVGVPFAIAAACLGKGIEIAVMLRAAPRSRGALIGVMSWLGYLAAGLVALGAYGVDRLAPVLAAPLAGLARLPWPWLGLFLGLNGDGSRSVWLGVACCAGLSATMIAVALAGTAWGTANGLEGRLGPADAAPARRPSGRHGPGDPMRRKELLWLRRDRSALVQVVLIPATALGFHLFNLRGLAAAAQANWSALCGAALLLGTWFLSTIGPRSLASEGQALWIALTWPRGLESLLRAKARLWSTIANVVVGLVLCYAAIRFPGAILRIGLVGIVWIPFGRSVASRMVAVARATPPSGERERVSQSPQWAAQIGTTSVVAGVWTGQWPLAATGVVYAIIAAAAVWQNLRARLPFLLDPWSEEMPQPPTLLHAMVAIGALGDGVALLLALSLPLFGIERLPEVQSVCYGIVAVLVAIVVVRLLGRRGVPFAKILLWRDDEDPVPLREALRPGLRWGFAAVAAGTSLGLLATGYVIVARHLGFADVRPRDAERLLRLTPHARFWLAAAAVLVAPVAEEILFRGLLYRALDREWGGWRAVCGSAVFFASYHPVASWLPVGLLGAVNAVAFRRSRRLAPAVMLHATYNAVVLAFATP